MPETDSVRLDKWLWAVRLFKTRGLATEACRLGRVCVGGQPAKPARLLRIGDEIWVQQPGLRRVLRVRRLLDKRVGAPLVVGFLDDLTPPEEIERARREREENRVVVPLRAPGTGRPTKAQRRALDRWARLEEADPPTATAPD